MDSLKDLKGQLIHPRTDESCHNRTIDQPCSFHPGAKFRIVLIGDSHAGAISTTAYEIANEVGLGYLQSTQDSCPHTTNAFEPNNLQGDSKAECEKRKNGIIQQLNKKQDIVIYYSRQMNEAHRYWRLNKESYQQMSANLQNAIIKFQENSIGVIIIGPTPELPESLPEKVFSELRLSATKDYSNKIKESINTDTDKEKFIRESLALKNAYTSTPGFSGAYISPVDIFCKKDVCISHKNVNLYYYDNNHLSIHGAELLKPRILAAIQSLVDR